MESKLKRGECCFAALSLRDLDARPKGESLHTVRKHDCIVETHSVSQLPRENKASDIPNIEASTRLQMACRRPWGEKIIAVRQPGAHR